MTRERFASELARRARNAPTELDQLRAQWRVSQWTGEHVVLEAFGEAPAEKFLASCTTPEEARALIQSTDLAGIQSYYLHHNEVDATKAAKWRGVWTKQSGAEGNSVYDRPDIQSIRVVPIDIDPVRGTHKKDNASEPERELAKNVAGKVYLDIAEILGRDDCLSLLSSGNGWWIHLSVGPFPITEHSLVLRVLRATHAIYGRPEVTMDTTSGDLRRISPLVASWKRKWKESDDRLHRRVWVAAPERVVPLDLEGLERLVATLESRVPPEVVLAPISREPVVIDSSGDDDWAVCNAVRMTQVVSHWDDPVRPTCPVPACSAQGGPGKSSVRVLDNDRWNIFSCKHETCGQFKGGPVHYVAYRLTGRRGIQKGDRDTARLVLEWFRDNCGVALDLHEHVELCRDEEPGICLDGDDYAEVIAMVDAQVRVRAAMAAQKEAQREIAQRMREAMKGKK